MCQLFSLKPRFTITLLLGTSGDLIVLQIIHFFTSLLSVCYLTFGTLANVATDIDDKDFVCHVDFTQMHVIMHFLCASFPHLFIAGMSEQANANDNAAFKRQPFLNFHVLLLETGASTEGNDFVVLYHLTKF